MNDLDETPPDNWASMTMQEQADWLSEHRKPRPLPAQLVGSASVFASRDVAGAPAADRYGTFRFLVWLPTAVTSVLGLLVVPGLLQEPEFGLLILGVCLVVVAFCAALGAAGTALIDIAEDLRKGRESGY